MLTIRLVPKYREYVYICLTLTAAISVHSGAWMKGRGDIPLMRAAQVQAQLGAFHRPFQPFLTPAFVRFGTICPPSVIPSVNVM